MPRRKAGPAGAGQPLRLLPRPGHGEPGGVHPLTTLAAPLLPPRGAEGGRADVWEELDRAAAWVCDHWPADAGGQPESPGDRETRRQLLRVLCVAARSAEAAPNGAPALRPTDLPWDVPVSAVLRALRERLTAQTVAAADTGAPAADPAAVLRVAAALDRLDEVARRDATRAIVDQLTGAGAPELLVEMAHDMRSPLGSILFLVERMRAEAASGRGGATLTPSQQRQLALVYGAGFGLSAMVSDVMELLRGGDRLAGGEPAPLSLPEVVDSVRAIAHPLAEEKGLTLVVGEAPPESRLGHAAAIQRVLLNLVTNALKYTPTGTVTLGVEARGRSRVRFTVVDTGRGIPPSVLANLFHAFRRRSTQDYAFSSAGLGLAICQKLVTAMGGELEVESEPECGTRFAVELDLPPVWRV